MDSPSTDQSIGGSRAWRTLLLVVGAAGVLFCAGEAWLLYTGQAPFHQLYYDATAGQDRAVTRRMVAALLGMPTSVALVLAALLGPRVRQRPRCCFRIVGGVLLLTAVQGCGVFASLPYGFGSGYEHANAAQRGHMALASKVGIIALGLGLVAFALAPRSPRHSPAVIQEPFIT